MGARKTRLIVLVFGRSAEDCGAYLDRSTIDDRSVESANDLAPALDHLVVAGTLDFRAEFAPDCLATCDLQGLIHD
ncbi:hypothetical protein BDR26DRAFT_862152 [Obelidium mucronatum]|nr:hypothetical protein BDR26DRAFT_862152 [Obelidium mucronatum]